MQNKTSFVFTGDIAFDKYMDHRWEDPGLISEEILSFLHSADHVVVDVEGPVSAYEQDPNATGMSALFHTIDPAAVSLFQRLGADVWDINNNHMMDIGPRGLMDTLENAKQAGAKTIGAGRNLEEAAQPLYFPEAGGVGMFAVGYRGVKLGCRPAGPDSPGCLQWNEDEIIRNSIQEIKSRCRWCIIVCHGGEEFTSLPSPYVRDRYISFLEMGADIVVGHHPHVPNNYELFWDEPGALSGACGRSPGKAIFYSLGNFIFDTDYQRSQYNTDRGVLLKLELTEEGFRFEPMGIRILRGPETVVQGEVPAIFQNVPQEEYEKLAPLAARMHLQASKRQMRFLFPEKYKDASEADWEADFLDPHRIERIAGEIMDFTLIYRLARKEAEGAWKNTSLEQVRDYILAQM